ncbi:MAG: flagellar hook-basal body complex protein [Tissierella sp.]|nr:flagellar hook-basal body complex protein [Tissierella sp.]
MLRSLYSGVSGMRGFQTKMDVIANNIANVNTIAYKSSRVSFQDMLSQTTANASAPSGNGLGGINARQIGLGVKVGSIDMMMGGGALQPTNRNLDFGIENEGFFMVSSDVNVEDETIGVVNYTRDGAFFRDAEGNLVNASGQRVLGYGDGEAVEIDEDGNHDFEVDPADFDGTEINDFMTTIRIPETLNGEEGGPELQSYSIDTSGLITAVYTDEEGVATAYVLGQMGMARFSNPEGLTKAGGNNYIDSNNSGQPQYGIAGSSGYGTINQGFLEMSNVDLANEFTEMIVASRAYSANSRSITTSDEMLQELINLKR